jgi:putative ABC transport system permease protein
MSAAWRALTGGRVPGPSRVLAVVLLVTVFVVTAAPRLLEDFQTKALRSSVAATPAIDQSLSITTGWPLFSGGNGQFTTPGYPHPGLLARETQDLATGLRPPLKAIPGAGWTGVSTPFVSAVGPVGAAFNGVIDPQLEMEYRDPVASHLRVISGALPQHFSTVRAGHRQIPELQVVVTQATAARFGVHVGSQLPIVVPATVGGLVPTVEHPPPTAILRVTGIVAPTGAAAAFWSSDNILGTPSLQDKGFRTEHWAGATMIGPAEIAALPRVFRSSQQADIVWDLPLQLGSLTASSVPRFQQTLQALQVTGPAIANVGQFPQPLSLTANPAGNLTQFQGQAAAADQVLSLIITGLFLIGLVLVGLAARLLTVRREAELAALRARGISLPGLARRVLADTGPVLVIAAAAGIVLGSLASGGESVISSWELAVALAAAAAAVPPLLAVARHRHAVPPGAGRADVTIRRRSPRRVVAELSAAVLAVGVVVGLRQQAPGRGSGVNVLNGTGPQLVALLAALVAIRCYPLPLRAALRLAGRRRGAAAYLGLARAARAASTALLPALALILAMALAGFGGLVVTTIGQARTADSWRQVGADASVSVGDTNPISPAGARALRQVPGTQQAVTVSNESGELVLGGRTLVISAIDAAPAPYAALSAATPFGGFDPSAIAPGPGAHSRGTAIPVLVSPSIAQFGLRTGVLTVDVDKALKVRVAGVLKATPAMGSGAFVVVPAWAANRDDGPWPVNQALLIGNSISARALRTAVASHIPGGHLQVRADVLRRAVAASPLASPAQRLFLLCLVAAALLAVAAAGLGMVLSADSRRRLLTTLTALGLRSRQLRAIALLESLPLLLVSVAGGLLAALALPAAVGPALSLAVFVGPGPPVSVQLTLLPLLAAAAGTAVVVLVIALGQSSAAARAGLGQAVREGDGG